MSGVDLSGDWVGMYHYSTGLPPNRFEAAIRDGGGAISGVIAEPDELGSSRHAVIDGSHDGTGLSFVKVYDDLDFLPVHYSGTILGEGEEIEGRWTIPGDWSGTFFMIRGAREEAAATRKISEKV